MRLTIAAIGRLKPGPELDLISEYTARASTVGRKLGLGPVSVTEVDERKARDSDTQSERLLSLIPGSAVAVALDERGNQFGSRKFAEFIGRERDAGRSEMVFLIGGADGHAKTLRTAVDHRLSLGQMVWPHMLVRVMLAEQIYRAASILLGSPYHRD